MTVQSAPTYSTSASTCVAAAASCVAVETAPANELASGRLAIGLRLSDYLELAKPRIAAMALLTVLVGYTLGGGAWNPASLSRMLLGIGLVAAASGAFNQLIERRTDALMARTANRPLPTGRLQPAEVALFGVACASIGVSLLYFTVNPTTACARRPDAGALRRCLYATQTLYGPQHGRRCDSRSVAADSRLDGLGGAAGLGRLFALCRIIRLAVSTLPGDRLAVSPRLCRGRAANVAGRRVAHDRPRSVAGFLACGYAAVLVPVSLLPGQLELRRRALPRGRALVELGLSGRGGAICLARIAGDGPRIVVFVARLPAGLARRVDLGSSAVAELI